MKINILKPSAMANTQKSNEEMRSVCFAYLSDRRIATLQNEIAAIYSRAIPTAIIKDKEVIVIYSPSVEYEAARCRKVIADIIKESYPDLIALEV